MTRISATYQPIEQCDKMLGAELYEIVRVPNHIIKVLSQGKKVNFAGKPEQFKLGSGHVKFFYDKMEYLKRRYEAIVAELKRRGTNVSEVYDKWHLIPEVFWNDWTPTQAAREEMCERINSRLQTMRSAKEINGIRHLKYCGEWTSINELLIQPNTQNTYDI